jgi:hypothetical protein
VTCPKETPQGVIIEVDGHTVIRCLLIDDSDHGFCIDCRTLLRLEREGGRVWSAGNDHMFTAMGWPEGGDVPL